MKVSDLDTTLRQACWDRGRTDDEEITPLEAVAEWSGWELGDPEWAKIIIQLYEDAQTDEREATA